MRKAISVALVVLAFFAGMALVRWGCVDDRIERQEEADRPLRAESDAKAEEMAALRAERDSAVAEAERLKAAADAASDTVYVYTELIVEAEGRDYSGLTSDSLTTLASSYCPGWSVGGMHYLTGRACVEDFVSKSLLLPLYEARAEAADERDRLRLGALLDTEEALTACDLSFVSCTERVSLEQMRAEGWRRAAYDVGRERPIELDLLGLGGLGDTGPTFRGYLEGRVPSARLVVQAGVGHPAPTWFVMGGVRVPLF